MARTVKILFRDNLVSAGRSLTGAPVQGKQRVVGRVEISTYAVGGEDLKPNDLGLTNIDYASFRVVDEIDAANVSSFVSAKYDDSAQKLVLVNTNNLTTVAEGSGNATVQFEVVGDSASLVDQVV